MSNKSNIGEFKLMFSHHLICNGLVDNMVIKQDF